MTVNSTEAKQVVELLQGMTAEAGFNIAVRPTEAASAYQYSRRGDFDAFFTGFIGRGDPDTYIHPTLACSGPYNEGRYCNAQVDELLDRARSEFAPEERKRLYAEATSLILRDRPNLYLYVRRFLFGYSARLSGFRPIPGGFIHPQGLRLN